MTRCPLLNKTIEADKGLWVNDPGECLKEECAWWLEDNRMCAIRDLALETRYTQLRLADLTDRMKKLKGGN